MKIIALRSKILLAHFPIIWFFTAIVALQQNAAAQTTTQQSENIKIDTSLVTVPLIVKDINNRFVTGLAKNDFTVQEEGKEQEIASFSYTEDPLNIALIFDTSPSTKDWISNLRKYAISFIKQLRPQDQVTLVSFAERVHFFGEFTNDQKLLTKHINNLKSGIATAFYDAVSLTITEKLAAVKGRKALIVFTDGRDSWSHRATADSTLALVTNAGIPCYIIQYWTDNNTELYLNALATASGALHLPVENIKNADTAFAAVAEELSHQYTIDYYPSNERRDGSYRKISVRVNRKGTKIRARQGYRAPKD